MEEIELQVRGNETDSEHERKRCIKPEYEV